MTTTNGGGGGGAPIPPSPTSPTYSENGTGSTHTKNTAALSKRTSGDIPPPLIGSSLTGTYVKIERC